MTFETNLYSNNKINKTRPINKTIQTTFTTHIEQPIPSNRLTIRRQLNKVNRVSNFNKAPCFFATNKQIQGNRISIQTKKKHPKNSVSLRRKQFPNQQDIIFI